MTIKRENCPYCMNEGVITVVAYNSFMLYQRRLQKIPFPSYQTVKDFCSCEWGRQAKEIEERMSRPGYVNPLASMTDEEILRAIDYATDNQKAIDEEFNL